jgi:hypothetical protein
MILTSSSMVVPKRSEDRILSFMRYMAMKRSLVVSLCERHHSFRKLSDSESACLGSSRVRAILPLQPIRRILMLVYN